MLKAPPPVQFSICPQCESGAGLLTLSSASSAAGVPPHGDSLLVLQDISEVGEGAVELPAVDSLGSLAGVLEGYAEVAAAGASRLCAVNGGGTVANLQQLIPCSERAALALSIATADVPFCRDVLLLLVDWRREGKSKIHCGFRVHSLRNSGPLVAATRDWPRRIWR